MRRSLAAALIVVLMPASAHAFDPTPHRPRVGLLRSTPSDSRDRDSYVASAVQRYLRHELRERGVDVVETNLTYDDLRNENPGDADYYIELVGTDSWTSSHGGVGIGTRDIGLEIEVVVARVASEVRVYDAETMETITTEALAKRNTAVVPSYVTLGSPNLYAVVAIPIFRRAQYRSAAQATARAAATVVTSALAER